MGKTVIRHLFNIDQHVELYADIINENLQCPPEIRARYIETLRKEMKRFMQKNPNALMSDICRKFGDPYDQREGVFKIIQKLHEQEMRKRNLLFMGIAMVLIVLLVVAIACVVHYALDNNAYVFVSDRF